MKVSTLFIVLVLISFSHCKNDYDKTTEASYLDKFNKKPSLVFTEEIQMFRHEIQSFQKESLERIESAFWTFYENFNSELHRFFKRLGELQPEWNKMCETFPMTNLNLPEIRKFSNICDDTAKFIRKMLVVPEIYAEKLNSGFLNSSLPTQFMEILFKNLNSILNHEISKGDISHCLKSVKVTTIVNYRILSTNIVNIVVNMDVNRYTRYFTRFTLNTVDEIER